MKNIKYKVVKVGSADIVNRTHTLSLSLFFFVFLFMSGCKNGRLKRRSLSLVLLTYLRHHFCVRYFTLSRLNNRRELYSLPLWWRPIYPNFASFFLYFFLFGCCPEWRHFIGNTRAESSTDVRVRNPFRSPFFILDSPDLESRSFISNGRNRCWYLHDIVLVPGTFSEGTWAYLIQHGSKGENDTVDIFGRNWGRVPFLFSGFFSCFFFGGDMRERTRHHEVNSFPFRIF